MSEQTRPHLTHPSGDRDPFSGEPHWSGRPPAQPRHLDDAALTEGAAFCDRCEGDGSYREMAPCTTFGPGCGCNEWVVVDPCPACGGSGRAPC